MNKNEALLLQEELTNFKSTFLFKVLKDHHEAYIEEGLMVALGDPPSDLASIVLREQVLGEIKVHKQSVEFFEDLATTLTETINEQD